MGVLVKEQYKLKNGMTVLSCDAADVPDVSIGLKIGGIVFEPKDYEVSPSLGCFSNPKTCEIVIKKKADLGSVCMIEFI